MSCFKQSKLIAEQENRDILYIIGNDNIIKDYENVLS